MKNQTLEHRLCYKEVKVGDFLLLADKGRHYELTDNIHYEVSKITPAVDWSTGEPFYLTEDCKNGGAE